jgi:hypothetical protein
VEETEKGCGDDAEDEFEEERECENFGDRDSGTIAWLSMPSVPISSTKEGRLCIVGIGQESKEWWKTERKATWVTFNKMA